MLDVTYKAVDGNANAFFFYGERRNNMDFLNFQEWLALEHFFGARLAYEEYNCLSSYYNEHEEVDGEILEIENIYEPIRVGDIAYFTNRDSDSDIENAPVKIIRLLTPAEADLFEVGPMFKVQLKDGTVEDAFFDELTACKQPERRNHGI